MENNPCVLIFSSRLAPEKGGDLLPDFCHETTKVYGKNQSIYELHIFGSGPLTEEIEKLSRTYTWVQYYGRVEKKTLLEYQKAGTYTLMPSRFLETFGLSALDSISLGVPVLGYKKGGLEQFGGGIIGIDEKKSLFDEVEKARKNTDKTARDRLSKECKIIAGSYNWSTWIDEYHGLFSSDLEKKEEILGPLSILHISDYTANIGGIESYIHQVIQLQKDQGAKQVGLIGYEYGLSPLQRYLLFPVSLLNFSLLGAIKKYIDTQNQPIELIWRHSIHRVIGRFPLWRLESNRKTKERIMYHDFGLFHPFPSKVRSVEQLEINSLRDYLKEGFNGFGMGRKILISPFLLLKRISSTLILKILYKRITTHLVPSVYMEPVVRKKYLQLFGKDAENIDIKTLSHAI